MFARPAAGLTIAPIRLRLLAGLVNALPLLIALVAGGFAASEFARTQTEKWTPLTNKLRRVSQRGRISPERTKQLNVAWSGALEALGLGSRNSRTPGARVVGIRRVDARTGGPITVRQALTRAALAQFSIEAGRIRSEEVMRRTRAIEPDLAKVREAHPHDRRAEMRETMALYEQHGINPARSCGWIVARSLLMALSVLIAPRHQTLPDLLAGTVVVVDR